jgi:hypothetical protein
MDKRYSQVAGDDGLVLCPRKARSHIMCAVCVEMYEEKKCGEHNCTNYVYARRASMKQEKKNGGRRGHGRRREKGSD